MPDPVWISKLKQLLCKMYQEWGGDCTTLPGGCPAQIAVLAATYSTQGDPPLSTQADVKAFLDLLDQIDKCLGETDNCIEDADTQALEGLVADLRRDFTPPTS